MKQKLSKKIALAYVIQLSSQSHKSYLYLILEKNKLNKPEIWL